MFAVIKTGGKQYLVTAGQKLQIEKLEGKEEEKITFGEVLLAGDDNKTEIGMPHVKNAHVEGKIIRQGRARKVIVFKYHSKTRYRKFKGHRQPFMEVLIEKITA